MVEPDAPTAPSSTSCDDDVFTVPSAQRGEADLIVLYDDLLDLDTPPSTPPQVVKQLSSPSSPLLTLEQTLRLFEPPQLHYSPELTPVDYTDVNPHAPLVELDSCEGPAARPRPPHTAPSVPRAPSGSYTSSQSSSRPSSQPTQLSSTRVSSVSTQFAARASPLVPPVAETPAQSRPYSARPGESPSLARVMDNLDVLSSNSTSSHCGSTCTHSLVGTYRPADQHRQREERVCCCGSTQDGSSCNIFTG